MRVREQKRYCERFVSVCNVYGIFGAVGAVAAAIAFTYATTGCWLLSLSHTINISPCAISSIVLLSNRTILGPFQNTHAMCCVHIHEIHQQQLIQYTSYAFAKSRRIKKWRI